LRGRRQPAPALHAALVGTEEALDRAVLERVETDHREASPRTQPLERGRKAGFERAQFVVDEDAQRLEGPRGRLLVAFAIADRACDQRRKLRGALDARFGARSDDRACDASRQALLAQAPQHVGDLALIGARKPIRDAFATVRIHAHVERTVGLETEAARGLVELWRRHAEIEQHAVEPVARGIPVPEIREARPADAYARIVAEPGLRIRDRDRIAVDEQQTPFRPEPFEQASRVAAAPVGAVEIDAIGAHVESIERLLEQYRNV